MRKGKSVEGLKVIGQEDGTALGTVKDVIFDHETNEVLGLLLSEKELFGLIDAHVVLWSTVRKIGPDAIVVISRESVISAGDSPRIHEEITGHNSLVGRQIHTNEGRALGNFSDIYFEDDGRIVGYEISTGLIGDAMSGRRFMPVPSQWTLGEDVALVPPEVGEQLDNAAPGGLQAATASAKESVSGAYDTAATHVTTAYGTAHTSVTETYANIASASVEKQKAWVVGKTASRDVVLPAPIATQSTSTATSAAVAATPHDATLPVTNPNDALHSVEAGAPVEGVTISELNVPTPAAAIDMSSSGDIIEGEVLVREGETITAQHADRAESAGILHQLLMAAATSTAQESAQGAMASGTTTAQGYGDTLQDRAALAAIGKPSARDVTAPNGSTIVATGMIITPEIMSQARLYGKEKEVIAAAGLGAASEAASAGIETVKEGATNLWDTIKEKATQLTGAAQNRREEYDEQAEQSRINDALGRPVNRVILDPHDHVILNAGDLITHAAVNRARESGVLEILLDSVYFADPVIAVDALRTDQPGEAALPNQVHPATGTLLVDASADPSAHAPTEVPCEDTDSQSSGLQSSTRS
jgi:uncharacterized protein YrrD